MEDRKLLKEQVKQAKERFNTHTSFENILFASELLDLESKKYGIEDKKEISLKLSKISYELSMLLEEVLK